MEVAPIWQKTKNALKKIPYFVKTYRFFFRQYEFLKSEVRKRLGKRVFPRNHFETIFASKQDPWSYAGAHQQERLKLLFQQIPKDAKTFLEIGCAEGIFTRLLAGEQKTVIAIDLSRNALIRAKDYCKSVKGVHFLQADMASVPLAKQFDVIVCAGVLVYLAEWDLFLKTANRILSLLSPGGHLLLEHMWKRSGASIEGEKIHEYFLKQPKLLLVHFVRNKEYGISLFKCK